MAKRIILVFSELSQDMKFCLFYCNRVAKFSWDMKVRIFRHISCSMLKTVQNRDLVLLHDYKKSYISYQITLSR